MSDQNTKPQVFNIDFQVVTQHGLQKGVFTEDDCWSYSFLPRVGDTINIDSGLFKVIAVEHNYKNQLFPIVYLKPAVDFEQFLQTLKTL